jgi:hypothetical protein
MTMAKVVQRANNGAEVTGRHFLHRGRQSYATSLLRRGADIHVVQRLLGQSNIATTTSYLHLSDAALSVEEQLDRRQIGSVRHGEHRVGHHLLAHKRRRLLKLLDPLGDVGGHEGAGEVEAVGPVLSHRPPE